MQNWPLLCQDVRSQFLISLKGGPLRTRSLKVNNLSISLSATAEPTRNKLTYSFTLALLAWGIVLSSVALKNPTEQFCVKLAPDAVLCHCDLKPQIQFPVVERRHF